MSPSQCHDFIQQAISAQPRTLAQDLWHDYFRVCSVIAWCALINNFLVSDRRFCHWPRVRAAYSFLCDMVSALALNWRKRQPTLGAIAADDPDCE